MRTCDFLMGIKRNIAGLVTGLALIGGSVGSILHYSGKINELSSDPTYVKSFELGNYLQNHVIERELYPGYLEEIAGEKNKLVLAQNEHEKLAPEIDLINEQIETYKPLSLFGAASTFIGGLLGAVSIILPSTRPRKHYTSE